MRVVGDIAPEAIRTAERLLADVKNVELHLGNGFVSGFADASFDVVYSFAAIGSMPVRVLASYLIEISRVLAPSGLL